MVGFERADNCRHDGLCQNGCWEKALLENARDDAEIDPQSANRILQDSSCKHPDAEDARKRLLKKLDELGV